MAHRFTGIYYHLIWSTKERAPLLCDGIEGTTHAAIRRKCEYLGVWVYALGGASDHVHLVCDLPPALALSDLVKEVKGASSRQANRTPGCNTPFRWQSGYAALTFARRDLPHVVAYVEDQPRHHRERTLSPAMERLASN